MASSPTLPERFLTLAGYEKVVLALSLLIGAFLIIDPLVLSVTREFDPETLRFFRVLTSLGKSEWILISAGILILIFAWMRVQRISRRRHAGYGLAQQLLLFLFGAVALSGVASSLLKNVLGRARPKYFDQFGPVEFQPFTFDYDFASFPSGHATTTGALAGVLAIVWPRARVPIFVAAAWIASTRFLIGAHYFSDAVAGAAMGLAFAYFLRDRLALRGWLFRKHEDGAIKLRGRALLRAATLSAASWIKTSARGALERATPDKTPRH